MRPKRRATHEKKRESLFSARGGEGGTGASWVKARPLASAAENSDCTVSCGKRQALASAVHSVVEHVEVMLPDGPREAVVQATNVYHKTAQGWRLVAHHASPGLRTEPPEVLTAKPVLH